MKVLLLMPCDETGIYDAAKIYSLLPKEVKDKTFLVPNFVDYLMTTKAQTDINTAIGLALFSAGKLLRTATEEDDDLLVIGNAAKKSTDGVECSFDEVYSFSDSVKENGCLTSYQDLRLEELKKVAKELNDKTLIDLFCSTVSRNSTKTLLEVHDFEPTARLLANRVQDKSPTVVKGGVKSTNGKRYFS